MSHPDTYLMYDGNCAEAMRFYERTLGGKLEMLLTHAQSPMAGQTAPEDADKIMHARLVLPGGGTLMGSDTASPCPYNGKHGFALALMYDTAAEARRVFEVLAEDGEVSVPVAETFWAEAFGTVTDRFGTPWMVNGGMKPMGA